MVQLAEEGVTISATLNLNPTVVPGNNTEGLNTALAFNLVNPDGKARSKFYYKLPVGFNETRETRLWPKANISMLLEFSSCWRALKCTTSSRRA